MSDNEITIVCASICKFPSFITNIFWCLERTWAFETNWKLDCAKIIL